MVKSHETKCQNCFPSPSNTAKTSIMGFDYYEEYVRNTSNKILYKKSKCSFSCHSQIDKKSIIYIKKDSRGKNDSNFAYELSVRKNLM